MPTTPKDQAPKKHDDQNKSVCPYCKRAFVTPDELTLHIISSHSTSVAVAGGPAVAGSGNSK